MVYGIVDLPEGMRRGRDRESRHRSFYSRCLLTEAVIVIGIVKAYPDELMQHVKLR